MNLSLIETQRFQTLARATLQGALAYAPKDFMEVSSEAMGLIAGKVFSLAQTLESQKVKNLDLDELGHAVGRSLVLGASGQDYRGMENLQDWFYANCPGLRLYTDPLGALQIEGYESRRPRAVCMVLSEGPGRFGAMFTFTDEAVTTDELALRSAKNLYTSGWRKQWLKRYAEVPV